MRYISILLILSATISSCGPTPTKVADDTKKDTVTIDDYLRGTDTLVIDTTVKPKKKCKKSLDSQMQSLRKMENKLDRLKRKMKERQKKRNKRKGNAYL